MAKDKKEDSDYGFGTFIEALKIFEKYGEDVFSLGAEHDTIYVYCDSSQISYEDQDTLKSLDWGFDGEHWYYFV